MEPRWLLDVNTTVVQVAAMARDDPQLKVRMPDELHRRVVESAREAGRSLNAEIVARLSHSFEPNQTIPELANAMTTLANTVADMAARQAWVVEHLDVVAQRPASVKAQREFLKFLEGQPEADPPDVIGEPYDIPTTPPPRTPAKRRKPGSE